MTTKNTLTQDGFYRLCRHIEENQKSYKGKTYAEIAKTVSNELNTKITGSNIERAKKTTKADIGINQPKKLNPLHKLAENALLRNKLNAIEREFQILNSMYAALRKEYSAILKESIAIKSEITFTQVTLLENLLPLMNELGVVESQKLIDMHTRHVDRLKLVKDLNDAPPWEKEND